MSRGAQKAHLIPLLLISFLLVQSRLSAQTSSSVIQVVTVEVKPITKIAVDGNPASLNITGDVSVESVRDHSTRYSMVTNLEDMKIVASISDVMPGGTKLLIEMESTKGVSRGPVDISSARTPVNVVTGIGRGSDLHQTISYTFAASESVTTLEAQSRVITLTLTD